MRVRERERESVREGGGCMQTDTYMFTRQE
jgi:hypothetical protein